jgi:hypothetical protein
MNGSRGDRSIPDASPGDVSGTCVLVCVYVCVCVRMCFFVYISLMYACIHKRVRLYIHIMYVGI